MDDTKGTGTEHSKTLTFDVDYFQSFLDDMDIPDHKKQELIEALWSIAVQFVDWGFGIHPMQQSGHILPEPRRDPLTRLIADAATATTDTEKHPNHKEKILEGIEE